MATQTGDPGATYNDDAALDAAAAAAVTSLDTVLDEAMDAPGEDGISPRQTIEGSLTQLRHIDMELARIAKKGGDPAERELLLAWLNVLGQAPELQFERDDTKKPRGK